MNRFFGELRLERIEKLLFRGQSVDPGWGRLYGGHVLGQALAAAQQTVGANYPVHSCHSYFLRPGAVDVPVIYDVELIREGRTITTRRVAAIQHGKPILFMTASFQVDDGSCDTSFLEHQHPSMPDVPPPEALLPESAHLREYSDKIPRSVRDLFLGKNRIELRPVEFKNPFGFEPSEPTKHMWMRATEVMPDDDQNFHQCVLAYASDFHIIPTALHPHGLTPWQREVNCASVDHSIWFHKPAKIRMDTDWLLYSIDAPVTSRGRGFARGQFFSRAGELIASTAQEGVLRRANNPMPTFDPKK